MNGLDGFKFAELLVVMAKEAVDCMALIDIWIPRITYFRRGARAHLGPHNTEYLVLVPAPMDTGTTSSSTKIRGNAIPLNDRWGPEHVLCRSHPPWFC